MTESTRNRYFALRHGISTANEEGIIISHPANGVSDWGLSPRGVDECRRRLAPADLGTFAFSRQETVVYTSDFRRALETAQIFCEQNELNAPVVDTRLRERNFGHLEGKPIDAYALVWARDDGDKDNQFEECESTAALAARLRTLLTDFEARWRAKSIVLVSHGDPLQVLQTLLLGLRCNQHRSLPHLGNAELRDLGTMKG